MAIQGIHGLNMLLVRLAFELLRARAFQEWFRRMIQVVLGREGGGERQESHHTPCAPLLHASCVAPPAHLLMYFVHCAHAEAPG